MTNFDSYWDDPKIHDFEIACEIVWGSNALLEKYGVPEDWCPDTVQEIINKYRHTLETPAEPIADDEPSVYELLEHLYEGTN